jgi:hypothetical protein
MTRNKVFQLSLWCGVGLVSLMVVIPLGIGVVMALRHGETALVLLYVVLILAPVAFLIGIRIHHGKQPLTIQPDTLETFVGRRALYIEGGKIVVVRVERANATKTGMYAVVAFDASIPLICHYRRIRLANEDRVEFWTDVCPFGERWDLAEGLPFFDFGDDHWCAASVGFRLLFSEDAIARFARKDLAWIDEYCE